MTDVIWVVSSCALIAAVIAVRAIFGKKLSAGFRYALWGLVLIRLLIPGTVFSSPVSVESAVKNAEVVQDLEAVKDVSAITQTGGGTVIGQLKRPIRPEGNSAAAAQQSAAEPEEAEQASVQTAVVAQLATPERFERMQKTLELRDILNIIWYTGMALAAVYFIASNLRFYLRLRARRQRLDIDSPCHVYRVEGLSSSCLFLNSIYISGDTAQDPAKLACVLEHETAHRRHGDGIFAVLRSAALVLHWYNPLVWAAAFLSRRDSELFADAGAIKAMGEDNREDYGRTLIELSSRQAVYAPIACAATMMTGGKRELKSRITNIARRKKMGAAVCALALLLAAAAVGCSFLGGGEKEAKSYLIDYKGYMNSSGCFNIFAEADDTMYLLNGEEHILYFTDKDYKEWMPLCGRPDCKHKGQDCNAYINTEAIALYDRYLYFVEGDGQHRDVESPRYKVQLCRMGLDGTSHEAVCDLRELLEPEHDYIVEDSIWNACFTGKYMLFRVVLQEKRGMDLIINHAYWYSVDLETLEYVPILTEVIDSSIHASRGFTMFEGSGSHAYGMLSAYGEPLKTLVDVDLASGTTRVLGDVEGELMYYEKELGIKDGKLMFVIRDLPEDIDVGYTGDEIQHLYSLDLETCGLELIAEEPALTAKWKVFDPDAGYWYGKVGRKDDPQEGDGFYVCDLERNQVDYIPVSVFPEEMGGTFVIGRITKDYIFAEGKVGGFYSALVPPVWYLEKADIGTGRLEWRRWGTSVYDSSPAATAKPLAEPDHEWEIDLDGDGVNERIMLSAKELEEKGSTTPYIKTEEGKTIRLSDVASSRAGMATYGITELDGREYLLFCRTSLMNGIFDDYYCIYAIKNGMLREVRSGSLELETSPSRRIDPIDTEEVMAYVNEINDIWQHSRVLFSTDTQISIKQMLRDPDGAAADTGSALYFIAPEGERYYCFEQLARLDGEFGFNGAELTAEKRLELLNEILEENAANITDARVNAAWPLAKSLCEAHGIKVSKKDYAVQRSNDGSGFIVRFMAPDTKDPDTIITILVNKGEDGSYTAEYPASAVELRLTEADGVDGAKFEADRHEFDWQSFTVTAAELAEAGFEATDEGAAAYGAEALAMLYLNCADDNYFKCEDAAVVMQQRIGQTSSFDTRVAFRPVNEKCFFIGHGDLLGPLYEAGEDGLAEFDLCLTICFDVVVTTDTNGSFTVRYSPIV